MQHKHALDPLPIAPRKPVLAALASLVLPGFGQFYNGDLNRAIWLFLVFALLCIPGVSLIALYLPSSWMFPALVVGLVMALGVWFFSIVDAWRGAQLKPERSAKPWQISGVYALVFVLCNVLALPALTLYVRHHQVEPFYIPSSSMEPSVLAGDMIWADKRYNCPSCKKGVHRGDIALFAYPNDRSVMYIKRVIGLPGDHIRVDGHQVWVNDQALQKTPLNARGQMTEGYENRQWLVQIATSESAPTTKNPPLNRANTTPVVQFNGVVPDGQVFVMGDNRQASIDSRSFGTVPLQDIYGQARQVWFSSSKEGIRWHRLGAVLE